MNTLQFTSTILERLEETKELKNIRAKVLNDENKVPDDVYDVACKIFNETLVECFHLGVTTSVALMTDLIKEYKKVETNIT